MRIFVSLVLLLLSALCYSQIKERALVSAGGFHFDSGELFFESSIGEIFTGFFAGENLQYLIGFHQPPEFTDGGATIYLLSDKVPDVNVYPNPSKGVINIAITDLQSYPLESLTITDIRGVLINRFQGNQIRANPIRLSFSDLHPGIYFMHLVFDNRTKEIVKISIVN